MIDVKEAGLHDEFKSEPTIASMILSDAASIYQGLMEYASHQGRVNNMWMQAYVRVTPNTCQR